MMPRCSGEVILRAMRSSATAMKSSKLRLVVLLERRLVPLRAELAAAADVGQDVDAAALEPGGADGARSSAGPCETSKPP